MPCNPRQPEGAAVDEQTLRLFAQVAGWGGKAAAMRVNRILATALGPGTKVLDIGTGPGSIPLTLQRVHPEAGFFGCDICYGMLRMACAAGKKKHVPLLFAAGDGQQLPYGDNAFDVIISLFALHHMDRPEDLLREVDRVLKPGGRLLIIDFRRDMAYGLFALANSLWQLFFFLSSGRKGFSQSVRSAWRPDEIANILNSCGIRRFQVHANPMELWIINSGDEQ
jgi:ubiquinone/menaquinone biosynthesis C-methylase UbiE